MISEIKTWEKLKERAKKVNLSLVVDVTVVRIENSNTEGVYFQAKDLREIDIYLSGYEYGRTEVEPNVT